MGHDNREGINPKMVIFLFHVKTRFYLVTVHRIAMVHALEFMEKEGTIDFEIF